MHRLLLVLANIVTAFQLCFIAEVMKLVSLCYIYIKGNSATLHNFFRVMNYCKSRSTYVALAPQNKFL